MNNQTMEQTAARYADMIYRIALNDTHSAPDAEDILQEVLLARFTASIRFETPEHEKRWLIRVTLNKGKNHRRFLLRHPSLSWEEVSELWHTPEQQYRELRRAVASLPRNWRRVIDLYYYEGYSTPEIASLLQVKEATIRTWLRRGRLKLKELLKEEWNDDEP